jgi:hypothetical protein
MLAFAVLGGAAIALRKNANAHKRLMILATICISNAGFWRWWGPVLERLVGDGYCGSWAQLYRGDLFHLAMLGAYHLISQRRLYSAYTLGGARGLGIELVAVWMYLSPWWKPVATVLIGS